MFDFLIYFNRKCILLTLDKSSVIGSSFDFFIISILQLNYIYLPDSYGYNFFAKITFAKLLLLLEEIWKILLSINLKQLEIITCDLKELKHCQQIKSQDSFRIQIYMFYIETHSK